MRYLFPHNARLKSRPQPLKVRKSTVYKLAELFVLFALLLILLGKLALNVKNEFSLLYLYGISVTLAILLVFCFSFLVYKDPYIIARSKLKTPCLKALKRKSYFVSCMVAVMNEEKNIAKCIDSIISQSYQDKEIIVVNDASTDNTLEILRQYERNRQIVLINLKKNVGKKKALAQAIPIAKGRLFAFTDSDSIWAPDALDKTVTIFQADEDVGAVSGHSRALNGDQNLITKIQDSWYEGQYSVRKAFESIWGAVTCVPGPLAVFRKEAIFNYIPAWENDSFLNQEFKFATDRTMTGFLLGSTTVGQKLKNRHKDSYFVRSIDYPIKDWKIVYSKSVQSWTIVPNTFAKLIRQQVRWKKSFIRNIFFTGLFYWKKPLLPALMYYLHILFVLAGPFIVFRHLIYFPMSGNISIAILYLLGIVLIGFMFGLAYKLENRNCHKWIYRPLMSLFSTLVLSWLIFYSVITVKKMTWTRG